MAPTGIRFAVLFLVVFLFKAEATQATYLQRFSSGDTVYYQKDFRRIRIVGLEEQYSEKANTLFQEYIKDSISLYDIGNFAKQLLQLYADDGYLDAKVYYRMIDNTVYLLFSAGDRRVWRFFEPTQTVLDSISGLHVSVEDFENSVEQILFEYAQQGYFSASFSIDSLWVDDETEELIVDINFDLGDQSEIQNVVFIPEKFNNTQVKKIAQSDDVKTVENLEIAKERLRNSGYFFGQLEHTLFFDSDFKFVAEMELEKSKNSYAIASMSSNYSGFSGFGDVFIFMPLARPEKYRFEFNLADKNAVEVFFRHDRILFYHQLISGGFYARFAGYDTTYFEIMGGMELYGYYRNGFYLKGFGEYGVITDYSERNLLRFGIGTHRGDERHRKFGFNDNHIDLYFKGGVLFTEGRPNDYVREIDFALHTGFLFYTLNPVLRLSYRSTNFSLTGFNKKMSVDTRVLRGYMPFNISTSLVLNSSVEVRYPLGNGYIFPFADFLWYAQNPRDYTLVSGYGVGIYLDFSPGSVKISSGWSPQRPLHNPVIHFDFSYFF